MITIKNSSSGQIGVRWPVWPSAIVLLTFFFLAALCLTACLQANAEGVTLSLDPIEQLATRKGPKVIVSSKGHVEGELSAYSPTLFVSDSGKSELEFTYEGPGGEPTGVAWSQRLRPGDNEVVVVQPWRRIERDRTWHIVAWARPSNRSKVLRHLEGTDRVTVISPIWWTIDAKGKIQTDADPALAAALHARGVAVWPAVHGLNADGLHTALSHAPRRSALAARLSTEARAFGVDGINIDLEGYYEEDADAIATFVEELSHFVHEWGGVVSYDLVPRSDDWEITPADLSYWSNAPRRRRLAAAVDFTILMAYDQFNDHRPSGPVAAPNWVEKVLIYQLRYSDPASIILGIPAYGRIWNPEDIVSPRAVPLSHLSGRDGWRTFDQRYCVSLVVRPDSTFYWAENDISDIRIEIARRYSLGGIAIWRMGLDDPQLWEAVSNTEATEQLGAGQRISEDEDFCADTQN